MSAFSIKTYAEDIWQQLRCDRRKALLCCAVSLIGAALGIVFFKMSNYNWWYANRCDFVCKLVYGGFFSVFVNYLLWAAVVSALLCVCSLVSWTQYLIYPLVCGISLYFGANCVALFECVGMLGLIYILLLLVVEEVINILCCFLCLNNSSCKKTFKEALFDCKTVIILQGVGILVKILLIFAVIRLITALI